MDTRLGSKFLRASVGFGGSCFQKDILNLVYICETAGLQEVADYWRNVVKMNEHQKSRFVRRIIDGMFNTVRDKRIAIFGFAFKKDTGDTRETPAIHVCRSLMEDGAHLAVYDPKVKAAQVHFDLSLSPFAWDHPAGKKDTPTDDRVKEQVSVVNGAKEAVENAHAILVLTEWDEFANYNYEELHKQMRKPAFIFDGRNILDHDHLRRIGFIVYGIGKPLDPFIQPSVTSNGLC